MPRIVLTCFGSYGDLFPSLAIARALKTRGHAPVVATSAYYRDLVLREGVGFHAVRPDLDPGDSALIARVMDPRRGTEVILRELLAPFVRDAFEDLAPIARDADLFVSHPITFATRLVAETHARPWVSTVLAPLSFFSAHDFPVLPPYPRATQVLRGSASAARAFMRLARRITRPWIAPVEAFRQSLGLPAAGNPVYEGQFSPYGTLALFSRVLGEPQADWPPRTTETGFAFYDSDEALPLPLQRFLDGGDPPVVFTLGSSAVGAAGTFFGESVAAVERLGCRAVLLVGRDPRNLPGRALPASILAVEYAPHAALFRRAAVVVHHGGVGTTGQALRAGRPMLVVPHAHDQPDNARRAAQLGVARVLDARRYTARRAASHLAVLLRDVSMRAHAANAAAVVAGERGADAACDVLEGVASRPVEHYLGPRGDRG